MFEFIAFLITLTIPGYLLVEKHFFGLEKWVLSVFLSLSVTSFFYYFMVSFFGITKEIIYFYALILLIVFFVLKKPNFKRVFYSIKEIKLPSKTVKKENLFELTGIFILVFCFSLIVFFIYAGQPYSFDDSAYHLPIINDFADDGEKTFFVEPKNVYELRSNQFPLLFESFAGVSKFFIGGNLFHFISFFSFVLSLFLVYLISKLTGYNEFFSLVIFGLTQSVLILTRYFSAETFLPLLFLGAVFFVLKFIKTEKLFFIFVSGFLAGLMFLSKFTGFIFFAGLFLFLLYKRKFKESVLFALIFVLISSVFFVSHLNVSFNENTMGAYGKIVAENIWDKPSLNFFKITEILFYFFSNNYYFFLIPLLFVLGFFGLKEKELDFFVLMNITFVLFLFVNVVNQMVPTYTGFPRYFLPIYSLLCIFAGIQLKKAFFFRNKLIKVLLGLIFIFLILFSSFFILGVFNHQAGKTVFYSDKLIPNN